MKRRATYVKRLGVFVTLGILFFIVAIYYIGAKNNLLGKTITIKGIFSDVSGLRIGNNVRYSGINVGTVADISLATDSLVLVKLNVQSDMLKVLRTDSRLAIASEGVMGNKVINITPGTTAEPYINDSDTLPTLETIKFDAILLELKKSSENATLLTNNLVAITDKINKGEGIFGKLFTDTALRNNLTRISNNTAHFTSDFADISDKINREEGTLSKLLTDPGLSQRIDSISINLTASSASLKAILAKVEHGQGIFGKIYTDTSVSGNLTDALRNLQHTLQQSRKVADNLEYISEKMIQGEGLLSRLLIDTALADSVETTMRNIDQSAKELEEAAKKVQSNWFIRNFSRKK